jgi:hypothetical protein
MCAGERYDRTFFLGGGEHKISTGSFDRFRYRESAVIKKEILTLLKIYHTHWPPFLHPDIVSDPVCIL